MAASWLGTLGSHRHTPVTLRTLTYFILDACLLTVHVLYTDWPRARGARRAPRPSERESERARAANEPRARSGRSSSRTQQV